MAERAYECRSCGEVAKEVGALGPGQGGPPDWCEGCSVGFDKPQPGDWREVTVDPEQEAAQAHAEAAQRLREVRKSNDTTMTTLSGRGAGLDTHVVLRQRTELLYDLLLGPLDLADIEAASPQRLAAELAWADRLRQMLGKALIETADQADGIATPAGAKQSGLYIPGRPR